MCNHIHISEEIIMTEKMKLKKKKLFEVKDKLVVAYKGYFAEDLMNRASKKAKKAKKGKEAKVNKSRNYMFAIIAKTPVNKKGDVLHDLYVKDTADSIIGLTIHSLCNGQGKKSPKVSL